MEELRIKAGSLELSVSGESGTVMEASRDFYNHLAARDQRETEAKMALVEGMRAKMAWYAKEHDEKHQSASAEKKREVAPASCNATLRMVQESVMPWETLSNRIMAGVNLAVGDKVDFRLKTGEDVTVVVTQSTDEYVRFESRDCVGKEVEWNKNGGTELGYSGSDIHKYLNKGLFEQLPEDLRNVISLGERKTKRDGEVVTFNTYLFLPAASEVFEEDSC